MSNQLMSTIKLKRFSINQHLLSVIFSAIFFCAGIFLIQSHEMWRDEGQAWLIAKSSEDFVSLFTSLKYEGHPGLWHLLLKLLGAFTSKVIYMQILHLGIATATVYLFLAQSPFSSLQKILFCFGYYSFYEYSIVSRNYGIGIFFLFLFCVFFSQQKKNYSILGPIVFLLAQTSIFGLILAIAALVTMIYQTLFYKNKKLNEIDQKHFFVGTLIAFFGIVVSILSIIPPSDSGFAASWHFYFDSDRLRGTLAVLANAFFPIPILDMHFWGNSNWNQIFAAYLIAPFVLFTFFKLFLYVRDFNYITLFLLIGFFGIELFLYTKYLGSWRHHGYIYFLFIAVYWLAKNRLDKASEKTLDDGGRVEKSFLSRTFTFILSIQLVGALVAHGYDNGHAFSNGKAAAQYLEGSQFKELGVSVLPDFIGPSMLIYMGGDRKFYFPQSNTTGLYVKWDNQRKELMDYEEAIAMTSHHMGVEEKNIIFVTNASLDSNLMKKWRMKKVAGFEGSIVEDENFFIYLLPKQ